MGKASRTALTCLAVALAILGAVYVRVLVMARNHAGKAEAALAAGRTGDAVFHFGRAARAYAPLNPWNEQAMGRLWQIGRKAEIEGEGDTALHAYREIRSSILAARSLYTPHPDRLEQVNERIARLMARQPPPPADEGKTEAERTLEHLALLADTPQPDPTWSALLILGFASWISACAAFILVGLDRDLRVRRRPALACAAVFVAGLGLWLAGMLLA